VTDVEWLVWDEWNLTHIWERHGLRPDAVEDVCFGHHIALVSYKERLVLIGPDRSGRILTVVIGPVPNRLGAYYVFSARPASRKERRQFFEQREQRNHE
jgi:uncharacterized DUF497 family protein